MKEIDRWLELYETHDKYTFVGHLVDDPVNEILQQYEDDENAEDEGGGFDGDSKSESDQEEPEAETVPM